MRALWRSGRRSCALDVYQRLRGALAHQQVLADRAAVHHGGAAEGRGDDQGVAPGRHSAVRPGIHRQHAEPAPMSDALLGQRGAGLWNCSRRGPAGLPPGRVRRAGRRPPSSVKVSAQSSVRPSSSACICRA
ncbi:hypothetical protein PUR34_19480 [Streptomyces sp. JV185]|uniref:hypothetical protein n=1 Tax=Streptomyces sp. JV185 TaxID=858638 RepID=UPI002E77FDE0|nr:hypothetical protein [Streptomyces sp. JV185]MEE1770257.1 hypothetical protein [Streptomyces sp. JV185]